MSYEGTSLSPRTQSLLAGRERLERFFFWIVAVIFSYLQKALSLTRIRTHNLLQSCRKNKVTVRYILSDNAVKIFYFLHIKAPDENRLLPYFLKDAQCLLLPCVLRFLLGNRIINQNASLSASASQLLPLRCMQ